MSRSAAPQSVLDREFLELRARVLEIAAALDRLDRADGPAGDDARVAALHRALAVLASCEPDRAEQVQLIFSIPYDESWRKTLGVASR